MKAISISLKVFATLAASMAVAATVFVGLAEANYRRDVRASAEESVATAQRTFRNIQVAETSKLGATLSALMADARMRELYVQRDREGLLEYAAPLYATLKSQYGITNMHFMDRDMFIFLRLHDPKNHSEVFWHQTAVDAIQSQKVATGMELGKFGFALRVASPYRDPSGKVVGYMEVAEDISRFVQTMKAQNGDDYAFVASKSLLDKHSYAVSMGRRKERNNWDDLPSTVVLGATSEGASLSRYDGDLARVPGAGTFLEQVDEGGRVMVRGVFPLIDVSNKTIGGIFVRHDVTELTRSMRAARAKSLVVIVGLLVVLSGLLAVMLRRLVFSRIERTMATATRVVGGDFERSIVPASDDEVGRLESLLEGFRQVFVTTVGDYERRLAEPIRASLRPASARASTRPSAP